MINIPDFLIAPEPRFDPATLTVLKKMLEQTDDRSQVTAALIKKGFPAEITDDLLHTANGFELPTPKIFNQQLIDPDTCQRWLERLAGSETKTSHTVRTDIDSNSTVLSEARITENVDITLVEDELIEVVNQLLVNQCSEFFEVEFAQFQYPQLLKYNIGGKYEGHSDSEYFDIDSQRWVPCLDRDISILCYLDQDYQGGELVFDHLNIKITPQTGMVVAFPSHYVYQHQAMPITKGIKHTLVSWTKIVKPPTHFPVKQTQKMLAVY
jgi:predicted 2-oxoglutarate/Fe(II)-dependent dioxygenase YbiX